MALQSELFKGDPLFENCLVRDAAHIAPGSRGDHIAKIHFALIVLDRFFPAKAELDQVTYGASTASGVLAYKRRRRIVNFGYQTQADNIVGKMTIAAMDAEMFVVESRFRASQSLRR